jgi:RNA polymerase-binding transcription factor
MARPHSNKRSRATRPTSARPAAPRPRAARADGARAGAVLAELRANLLTKRAELVAKLREEREGRIEANSQREKIEGTPFGDRPALSPDDERGLAVADRRAGMLVQINLALKKMDEGSYGRCEMCEEEINPARLRAHPFAVRCTRCQEAWEKDQSRADGAGRSRNAPAEESA